MSDMTLWGFDGSTYVRTTKMVLAEKGATEFKQVQLNVLKGDPKTPEHGSVILSAKSRSSTMRACAFWKRPRLRATSTMSSPASR